MAESIWTIGHSTRDLASFVRLLEAEGIELVADVRRYPASRRHPQFSQAALASGLAEHGIAYRHWIDLGGRRSRRAPGSPNTAWRAASFNAYADYMDSPAFATALGELEHDASGRRTAIMCAEALPWKCHRRLISDALLARGWHVWDIIGPGKVEPHHLTEFARVEGTRVTYPAEPLFGTQQASDTARG